MQDDVFAQETCADSLAGHYFVRVSAAVGFAASHGACLVSPMHRVQVDLIHFVKKEQVGIAKDGYKVSTVPLVAVCSSRCAVHPLDPRLLLQVLLDHSIA